VIVDSLRRIDVEAGGPRVYKQTGNFQKLFLAMLTFMTIVAILVTVAGAWAEGTTGPFLIIWFGMLAFLWVRMLDIPFKITILDGGVVEFRSYLRRRRVNAGDMVSIAPSHRGLSPGWVKLRHRGGSVILITQFDDFHDLVVRLKELNPQIQTRGV
jgi:hypothetical protein